MKPPQWVGIADERRKMTQSTAATTGTETMRGNNKNSSTSSTSTSTSSTSSNGDETVQGRSAMIPLPSYHISKTESEHQLCEDLAEAELRDLCMFYRVVNGIRERQQPARTRPTEKIRDTGENLGIRRSETGATTGTSTRFGREEQRHEPLHFQRRLLFPRFVQNEPSMADDATMASTGTTGTARTNEVTNTTAQSGSTRRRTFLDFSSRDDDGIENADSRGEDRTSDSDSMELAMNTFNNEGDWSICGFSDSRLTIDVSQRSVHVAIVEAEDQRRTEHVRADYGNSGLSTREEDSEDDDDVPFRLDL